MASSKRVVLVRPKQARTDYSKQDKKSPPENSGVYTPLMGGIYKPPFPQGGGAETETSGVESLLAQAESLSPADRKTLLARLALNQQAEKPGDRELEMWTAGVQSALAAISGGESGAAHASMIVKRCLAPSANWAPVAEFMYSAGFDKLEVVKRQSIYYLLGELLVKYAAGVSRKVSAPLTPKFVASCSVHLWAVFNSAFPGYLAAGLAPIVAQRLTERRG